MRPRPQSPAVLLARIREHGFASFSDTELRDAFKRLQSRTANVAVESLLPDCFAMVAEAVERRLGLRATDEQLLAGIALFQGRVAQMDAGEGKTVAAAFPAALHALLGRPVHVVTANDYLADRDAKLLAPVYESLGLSVGAVLQHTEEGERRHVYRRAIVYGAMRELGFDYLRDNLKSDTRGWVQRPELSDAVAIVDEADHALIDEAFTPMIISGNPMGGSRAAIRADRAVAEMVRAQQGIARELAAELDSAAGLGPSVIPSPSVIPAKAGIRLLARLLLAGPSTSSGDNPALQRRFAAHPRSLRQAWTLAEEHDPELTSELYYAVHPGNRYVTLTEKGREFLEQRLGRFYDGGNAPTPSASSGQALTLPRREREVSPGGDLPLMERRRRDGRAARSQSRRYGLGNQVLQSLRARLLLKRDVDYLVDGDGVALIDPHTGRPKPDNIYQHGLQAAVEAKEGVTVRPDSETLAWISVSGFVSLYSQVSGITGTAAPAAGEFRRKYGLEVAVVPPVRPPMRVNLPARVYPSREDKMAAVADEVASRHRMGQPVLAATRTVEQSEELSGELSRRGIPHQLLNAVTTHAEARIVRDAGRFGAVTVSTPMAGRGTDIVLEPGLNRRLAERCIEEIHLLLAEEAGAVDVSCPSPEQADALRVELERYGQFHTEPIPTKAGTLCGLRVTLHGSGQLENCPAPSFPRKRESKRVFPKYDFRAKIIGFSDSIKIGPQQGRPHPNPLPEGEGTLETLSKTRNRLYKLDFALGLCVIGTEIYDSRRVELQLRGRSGRQGEFGLAQTFLSLEDRLVNLDANEFLKLSACRRTDGAGRVCYAGPEVERRIERLQAAADREGEAQRSLMQDYAAEFDRQTQLYHQRRQDVILGAAKSHPHPFGRLRAGSNPPPEGEGIMVMCRETAQRVAARLAAQHLGLEADDDYPRRFRRLSEEARVDYGVDCSGLYGTDLARMPAELSALFVACLEQQLSRVGESVFPQMARLLWLQACGELWPVHIAGLRDSLASQLLSGLNHKSAVAHYVRRSNEAWREYWELVDAEFLSRLIAFPLSPPPEEPTVDISRETELLLGHQVPSPPGRGLE